MKSTPRSIGRYQVEGKIAVGGMAEVFKATLSGSDGFRKIVAIKRLLSNWASDPEFCRMLIEEAKLVSHLVHPNIVQVYELSRDGEQLYLALEYVNGVDLASLIGEPFPLEAALEIMRQSLRALAYAHTVRDEQGRPLEIIHRDVSPQNILISADGIVKLTDFGIARAALRQRHTVSGVLKGKFAYMSPEQASGEELDARSDLFSLGIVFYEMLAGSQLFSGHGDLEILEKVRRCEINFSEAPLQQHPDGIVPILQKGLARERGRRYASAQEFLREVESYASRHQLSLDPEAVTKLVRPGRIKTDNETISTRSTAPSSPPLRALMMLPLLLFLTSDLPRPIPVVGTIVEGYLNLQALPWGTWAIDDGPKLESPVLRYPLAAGDHQIRAFYAPGNRHLSENVTLRSGQVINCLATFTGTGGLHCN